MAEGVQYAYSPAALQPHEQHAQVGLSTGDAAVRMLPTLQSQGTGGGDGDLTVDELRDMLKNM